MVVDGKITRFDGFRAFWQIVETLCGQGAEGCEWVGENEPSFGKGGREKKGGGEIIIEEGRRAQKARLPRVRGPPRGSGERKRAQKKARPKKAC